MKRKKSKHDKVIDLLVQRLMEEGRYSKILINSEYYNIKYREHGEVDVAAFKGGLIPKYALFFEVKSNDSEKARKKAMQQLKRNNRMFYNDGLTRTFGFYVYSANNEKGYELEWIRE